MIQNYSTKNDDTDSIPGWSLCVCWGACRVFCGGGHTFWPRFCWTGCRDDFDSSSKKYSVMLLYDYIIWQHFEHDLITRCSPRITLSCSCDRSPSSTSSTTPTPSPAHSVLPSKMSPRPYNVVPVLNRQSSLLSICETLNYPVCSILVIKVLLEARKHLGGADAMISGKQQVLSGGHPVVLGPSTQYPPPSTFLAPTWGNTGHTPSRHHLGSSHQNSLQSWAKTLKMQISSWGIVWHSQIKPCLSFLPVEFSTMRASWKLSPTHSLNYQRVGCTSWYLPSSKNDHESKKVSNFQTKPKISQLWWQVDRLSSPSRHLTRCEGMISTGFPRPLHHKSQISAPRIISDFSWKILRNRNLLVVLISEILYLALNITPPSFKDLSNVKSEAQTSFFHLNVIEPIKVVPLTKKYTSCPRMCETFFFLVHILIYLQECGSDDFLQSWIFFEIWRIRS